MLFWIFMFVMDLLIPLVMVGFGASFKKHAPKDINDYYGYRTTMSRKNRETWEFAHKYVGRLWFVVGWILLVFTVISFLFLIGKQKDTIGNIGGVICLVQIIPMLATIVPTEHALHKKFDHNGNKKY